MSLSGLPDPNAMLGHLQDWWVDVRCVCGRGVFRPIGLLARQHGTYITLVEYARRLRCRRCGQRPGRVDLIERPEAGDLNYPDSYKYFRIPVPP